jgi:ABC-2 type transport system permease protein
VTAPSFAALPGTFRVGAARIVIELKAFFREPLAMAFIFALPAVLLLLLGSIFRSQVAGHGIGVGQVFAAGLIGGGIISTTFQNLAISIATERDQRMLKRLSGTPMPRGAYFIGKIGIVGVSTAAEVVILIAVGMIVDGLRLPATAERWWTFVWVLVLGTVACSLLGLAASSVPRSARSAAPVIMLPVSVIQFISGVYVPPTLVPTPLRVVASFFPVEWICQGMRSVFLPARAAALEPAGRWEYDKIALVLLAWTVAGAVLCLTTFRWRTRRDG